LSSGAFHGSPFELFEFLQGHFLRVHERGMSITKTLDLSCNTALRSTPETVFLLTLG
jgi:hypothetical protein